MRCCYDKVHLFGQFKTKHESLSYIEVTMDTNLFDTVHLFCDILYNTFYSCYGVWFIYKVKYKKIFTLYCLVNTIWSANISFVSSKEDQK